MIKCQKNFSSDDLLHGQRKSPDKLHRSFICRLHSIYHIPWFDNLLIVMQELFIKLTRIASIAVDMFVGRERFATLLLMKLTETVILWLSEDQSFWDDIEEGPRPLGPLGLQQVISLTSSYSYFCQLKMGPLITHVCACSFTWI